MIDVDYYAKNCKKITCDACGCFLCYGYIDYAEDSGFLCAGCKVGIEARQAPEVELQEFERICRGFDYMFCGGSKKGHDWQDITECCLVMGSYVYCCIKCEAQKIEPIPITSTIWNGAKVPELIFHIPPKDEINYKPWTKD